MYDWTRISKHVDGYQQEEFSLNIPFPKDSMCYTRLKAKIEPMTPRQLNSVSPVYLSENGVDPRIDVFKGEIGANNQMADYYSNSWDSFFTFYSNDLDEVFDAIEAYIDSL